MNKNGRRTLELLGKLRAMRATIEERGPLTEGGETGPILRLLDEKISQGEEFDAIWRSFVHGDEVPPPSVARQFKKEWVAWGKENMKLVSFLSLPPEAQLAAARPTLGQEAEKRDPRDASDEGEAPARARKSLPGSFSDDPENMPPFARGLGRLLHERYGTVNAPGVDYMLDPERLEEARAVEQYAWAFRVTETLERDGPVNGIGRIDSDGPPRLAESLSPSGSRWDPAEMLAAAELNDFLLAYGYDLGIGAEVEGAAELRIGEMDRVRAWETIVGLCQTSTEVLAELFNMAADLLPLSHEMATRNTDRAARYAGLRVGRAFPHTARLLVNAGLLMRAVQQDTGPGLWAALSDEYLEVVRARWPTPERSGFVS